MSTTPRTRPRLGAFSEYETDAEIFISTPSRWARSTQELSVPSETGFPGQRLISVANRLPVTVVKAHDESWGFRKSSGGLVSALRACENLHMTQVGWPGADIPVEDQEKVADQMHEHGCVPVFLSREEIDLYYNGFSNGVLWPLLHYVSHSYSSGSSEKEWRMYESVNRKFAAAIAAQITFMSSHATHPSDILVWVHDYHLMLVPRYLRELVPETRIGWFLHTPFPSVELFRMLPYREEILRGILGANYVSFQVPDYARHFLSACSILLNLQVTAASVDAIPEGGCLVHVDAVPIGIDPHGFIESSLRNPEVADRVEQLRMQFRNKKIILGVDRLDYMKGLEHKLQSFEKFLELRPEWRGECVLVQLAVPSRGEVKDYQRLKKHVHELVGELCGRYGDLMTQTPPVVYLDQSVEFPELVALYRMADVLLVTSIRDGMNLVAFEYVASQQETCGVLVLSEFTGAMQSLGGGAISINPWDLEGTADALASALTMSPGERMSRHKFCFEYVTEHTAQRWAETFLNTLQSVSYESAHTEPTPFPRARFLESWESHIGEIATLGKTLVVLCLNYSVLTRENGSRKYSISLATMRALDTILFDNCPNVVMMVFSPMARELISSLFADFMHRECNLVLVAENGCVYMSLGAGSTREWTSVREKRQPADASRAQMVRLLKYCGSRCPGSYVEETEFSVKLILVGTDNEPFCEPQVPGSIMQELLTSCRRSGPPSDEHRLELVATNEYIEIRDHDTGI